MTEEEQITRAAELKAEGLSASAIAERMGVSRFTVHRRLARAAKARAAAPPPAPTPPPAPANDQPDDRPTAVAYARAMLTMAFRGAVAAERQGNVKAAQAWVRAAAPHLKAVADAEANEPEPEIDWDSCLDEEPAP